MHEEQVEVAGVVDEEDLVAGRHHVACLLIVAVADLQVAFSSASSHSCVLRRMIPPLDSWPSLVLSSILRTFGIAAWPLNLLLIAFYCTVSFDPA